MFVRVDLFSGRFEELDWVKSMGAKEVSSLRRWCNALALNRRMKQMKAGPYSINMRHAIDWGKLCKETYFDYDEEDDFSPSVWKDYVESRENILTKQPPKYISLASLYPDCDMVSNRAIINCIPVSSLKSKHSPIELVYG